MVGAKDGWIRRAFVVRFTLRALVGAAIGMVLGVIVVALIPGGPEAGFLGEIGFRGSEWIWPLLVPVLAAGVAALATFVAAARKLKEAA